MILMFIAAATLASTGDTGLAAHRVEADHRGSPVALVYTPQTRLRTKDIGMSPPNRQSTARCLWTVDLDVVRHVEPRGAATPALHRTLTAEKVASGNRAGTCNINQAAIGQEVARSHARIAAQVQHIAANDRPVVMAELDSARAIASN